MLRDSSENKFKFKGKMQAVTAVSPNRNLNIYWIGTKVFVDRIAIAEVSTVTAATGSIGGKYFDVYSPHRGYRVWFTKDAAGTAPANGGNLLIKVDTLTADTAADIADKIRTAVLAVTNDFTLDAAGAALITFTNKTAGAVTDISAGTTGWTVATSVTGLDQKNLYSDVIANDCAEILDVTVQNASTPNLSVLYRSDVISYVKGVRSDTLSTKLVTKTSAFTV